MTMAVQKGIFSLFLNTMNRLYWILFFVIMPHLALAESFSSKIHLSVEKYHLKNGMKILLNPDHKVNMASYYLAFATGSRNERPGITGISHMFEHLMFKGTEKYPDFDSFYADKGIIEVNAMTAHEKTVYYASFPPDKLELILSVESDRMSNLSFTQEELDKERQAVQEERLLHVDNNPIGTFFEAVYETIFKKHAYRWPIIGTAEDIASYSLQDLNTWYSTYYSPNNAVLVISGNFSVSEAKKLIEEYFGPLPSKPIPELSSVREPEQTAHRSQVVEKQVQAPKAIIAWLIPSAIENEKEYYAMEFLSYILGTGESSLLYKKAVKESQMASYLSVYTHGLSDHAIFATYYSPLDLSFEADLKALILNEIQKALEGGLKTSFLEKVKNTRRNEIIWFLKRSSSRAMLILDHEMDLGDYRKIYRVLDLMDEMSLDFIMETGKKYLSFERASYLILKSPELKSR